MIIIIIMITDYCIQELQRSRTVLLSFNLVSKSLAFSVIFNKESKALFFLISASAYWRSASPI
jgi:hypothetical protein